MQHIEAIKEVDYYLERGNRVALYFFIPKACCAESSSVMDRIVNYRGLENIVFLAIDMDHPTLGVAAQERFEVTNVPFLIILGGVGNHGTLGEYRALPNSVRAVRNALTSSCRLQLEEQ